MAQNVPQPMMASVRPVVFGDNIVSEDEDVISEENPAQLPDRLNRVGYTLGRINVDMWR
jgi:hypothetical protein